MTHDAGMEIMAYCVFGSPGETKQQMQKTARLMQKLKADFVHYSIITPFPGTELYQCGLEEKLFNDYWREFARNPTRDFVPPFWEKSYNRKQLLGFLTKFYKSFYCRPGYIIQQLLKISSFSELTRKIKAGLRVLFG
jgi:anaerobic magnesium-protoporphyrin IX monomethyl ester cyclase